MTLPASLLNSVDVLDFILERFFWKEVDAGTIPANTLLANQEQHNSIALQVATQHKVLIPQAKHLVQVACMTVL